MNARDIARLLKPYEVSATDVKIEGVTKRGYRRDHLHDPWTRYLPPVQGGSATSATSATAQVNDGGPVAGSTSHVLPATSTLPLTCDVAQVAEVADIPQPSATWCEYLECAAPGTRHRNGVWCDQHARKMEID